MSREEIEAAVDAYEASNGFSECFPEVCINKLLTLADAYLAERAERQRRIEAAAEEIWRRIPKEFAHFEPGQVGKIISIITRHLEGDANEG